MRTPRKPSVSPRSPRRPKAASSPMPATAGGSTSGSSQSVITSGRPGNRRVASRYAAGVATSSVIPKAIPFVTAVTTSASRTTPSSSLRTRSPGETRRKIARTGNSKKPSARTVATALKTVNAARLTSPLRRRQSRPLRSWRAPSSLRSQLDHHRGRLDDGRGRHPGLEPELLDRVAGDDRDHAGGLGDVELDLGEQPLDLDLAHDAAKVIARAHLLAVGAAEARDPAGRHEPAVRRVALGADPAGPVPAAQRVQADPQGARGLGRGVIALPRHYLVERITRPREVHAPAMSVAAAKGALDAV